MTMAKKKGYERDPENGFIFPVRRIQENYGEEIRPVSSDSSSSSSSSSDEESSSECSSRESAGESAEGAPDADAGREPLAEEDRADYWVVQEDRIVRVHQTPRHDLFDPRSVAFPVPLDYIDVFRYSDTNVKGYYHHVDCWFTDDVAGQIPGSWIGKTTFHLRLPSPKPGWAIQKWEAHQDRG